MSVVVADITGLAPFASADVDDVQRLIDKAERRTNRAAWGVKADDGVIALVCHMLTVEALRATPGSSAIVRGPLTSQTVGPVSRSFAAPGVSSMSLTDAWFATTQYGQEYLELRGLVFSDRVGVL